MDQTFSDSFNIVLKSIDEELHLLKMFIRCLIDMLNYAYLLLRLRILKENQQNSFTLMS